MFPNFLSVEAYINSLINYEQDFPLGGTRSRPKLEPSLHAVERLNLSVSLPQCIHIAGTVGKGSVARFSESILSTRFKTLAFTSPHLESVKERVTLNSNFLGDDVWCRGFSEIVSTLRQEPKIDLTYFEAVWIFYLWAAKFLDTEAHVVETGLGGSWDATNILQNTIAVLTVIDLDHTAVLGLTPQEIARDKCGIIKQNSRVVVSPQPHDVLPIIEEVAGKRQTDVHLSGRDFRVIHSSNNLFDYSINGISIKSIELGVRGLFQQDNAGVAIRSTRLVAPELTAEEIRQALMGSIPRARQQLLPGSPPVLVDVAHNPAAFASLTDTIRREFSNKNITAIIAMMKDKDAANSLKNLKELVSKVYIVEANTPRSYRADDLLKIALDVGLNAESADRLEAFKILSGE